MRIFTLTILLLSSFSQAFSQQHSVARRWNEVLLEAIRNDYARPTIHARNLFHTSIALYDSWAIFDPVAEPYMLGKVVHDFNCPFNGITGPTDIQSAQEETMSYAAYRLLSHRFINSPNPTENQMRFDTLMANLGYDINFTSTDYSNGSYAALGNHLAANLIAYGFQDGSNETGGYANQHYVPLNPTLVPIVPGNPDIIDANRWQPLTLQVYIDQAGNVYPLSTPTFLGPEWGEVDAFALDQADLSVHTRDGYDYQVYHDPGSPPMMDTANVTGLAEMYQWSFELVAVWSSHLSSGDTTTWDISPASIGNVQQYPTNFYDHTQFYDLLNGGDISIGYSVNPYTGQPYTPQVVKRGDYARVLAEFWADGPASETPPGHWFTILNYVNDHPLFEKRYMGAGPILPDLEWDVKAYFTMAGTVHDAAVSAWGVKGWYDFIRPISAIRFMADLGQSSFPDSVHYHPAGLKLHENIVELVDSSDALAGATYQHVGKIKMNVWRGHDYITNTATDTAGVGWILAEDWWPYQRPSFVTPPFAGFVSGHSTFSRAAAEVMTSLTGNAYFPGGMGEFHAPMNEFLVFEDGPSTDVTLQWATYRDASDQCSLSRIWGGIHPTLDDIPGRFMGMEIGHDAFDFAHQYFEGNAVVTNISDVEKEDALIFPNPSHNGIVSIHCEEQTERMDVSVFDVSGKCCFKSSVLTNGKSEVISLDLHQLQSGLYLVEVNSDGKRSSHRVSLLN
ncbi:MAG: T9SS type A sorting domain-containing protein [Flavobacteriales bacterium]|nr:T9SS type A sorting domain-containing protein [Flavobacteriales bacterium]